MPTIQEISTQIKTSVQAFLPETSSRLANSVLNVFIESISGVFYTLYKGMDIVRRDSIALTAGQKRIEEFGDLYQIYRKEDVQAVDYQAPVAATAAVIARPLYRRIRVSVHINDPVFPATPAGSTFLDDQGLTWIVTTSLAEIQPGNSGATWVKSVGDLWVAGQSGTGGQTPGGSPTHSEVITTPVTIGSSVALHEVNFYLFVAEVIAAPAIPAIPEILAVEAETAETYQAFRERVIQRIHYRPQGGTHGDYVAWMLALPNVTHAFILPNEFNYGEILIGYKINGAIPSSGFDDQFIKDAIEAVRPLGTKILIGKPIPKIINTHIRLSPTNHAVKTQILHALEELFDKRVFRDGEFYSSWISEAISTAIGEDNHDLLSPQGNVKIGNYELPVLGSITYV